MYRSSLGSNLGLSGLRLEVGVKQVQADNARCH